MNKKVLYISYDGALDPLGYSQIIPYLLGLSQKGIRFTLITYEKKEKLDDTNRVNKLKRILENANIKWVILGYHKSPTVPATAFDITIGIICGLIIVLRDKITLIHARSFVGAIPALFLAKLFNLKFIFDMRGFWADERVDGNIWKNKGLLYKAAKWWEKIFLLNANWTVCLTEKAKIMIKDLPYIKKKDISIDVIPTCADMNKFTIQAKNRDLLTLLDLQDRFIFVYFGSIGTWYLLDEMIDFFQVAKRIKPCSFFMVLTANKNLVLERMKQKNVNSGDYLINNVAHEVMPDWISLADASLSFIMPSYSKKSSCPSKFAESLACGLPVVINRGVGDTDKFCHIYNIGVVVEHFCEEEYIKSAHQLFLLLSDKGALKKECRRVAEGYFSLEGGLEKYWHIYQKLNLIIRIN